MPAQVSRKPGDIQYGGVSSFGYSGTVAHLVLKGAASSSVAASSAVATPSTACMRALFSWRERAHPFAQRLLPAPDGDHLFRSPAEGSMHALVADHIVQNRVVFPGAGYLELARACAEAMRALQSRGALRAVFFLQQLVLESDGLHVECTISAEAGFEVRSGVLYDGALSEAPVHCSGTLATRVVSMPSQADQPLLFSELGSRAADVRALYDGFFKVGLQYGPGYRTLTHAWGGGGRRAAARLRVRPSQDGTHVHPADLDDALCVSALASSGVRETRLPFAVDDALLQAAPSRLLAVRSQRSHCPQPTSHSRCADDVCLCVRRSLNGSMTLTR